MSLYTPIFPHTNLLPTRTASSSSAATSNTQSAPVQSYSTSLLQWHLAIATLPEELSPPSAPPSPTSQARSMRLKAEIGQALREKRYLGDLCKLRCTVRGYATTRPTTNDEDDELQNSHDLSWVLPETEEEWFEWERNREQKRAERRASLKGKTRETYLPVDAKSQTSRERVLDWKARLCPTSLSNSSTTVHSLVAPTGRTPLGFPVVKRASQHAHKEAKSKTPSSFTPNEWAPRSETVDSNQRQNVGQEQQPVTDEAGIKAKAIATDAITAPPGSNAPVPELEHEVPLNLDPVGPEVAVAIDSDANVAVGIPDFSALFPPSFPAGLPTSTQKVLPNDLISDNAPLDASPPRIDSIPVHSGNASVTIGAAPENNDKPEEQQHPIEQVTSSVSKDTPVQLTPPSPPPSSADSPEVPSLLQRHVASGVPVSDLDVGAESRMDTATDIVIVEREAVAVARIHPPTTPPVQIRMLTPLSEEENKRRAQRTPTVTLPAVDVPRTPERTPLRKYRTAPYMLSQQHNSPQKQNHAASHHESPQYLINGGASVPSFPVTPPRRAATADVAGDPGAPGDILATSRRSLTRPRPPSRKFGSRAGTVGADVSEDEGQLGGPGDPSPAKSERSYFSSPASSGSSSGGSLTSVRLAPDSPPHSPLGGFTQSPGRFAPLAESTQPAALTRSKHGLGNGLDLAALGEPTQSTLAHSSQLPNASAAGESQKLGRFSSSFGLGAYNSQYDVDAHVDRLSNFMEQDVDFSAWLRNMDDEDENENNRLGESGSAPGLQDALKPNGGFGKNSLASNFMRESTNKDEDEEAAVESLAFMAASASPASPVRA